MSYIQKIVDYFFHHSVSPSIAKRVQERMILPQTSKECDEALARIWEETKDTVYTDPQIDKAFARLEHSMAGKAQLRLLLLSGCIPLPRKTGSIHLIHPMLCQGRHTGTNHTAGRKQCMAQLGKPVDLPLHLPDFRKECLPLRRRIF